MQLKIDRCKTGIGFLFIFLLLCSALGHSFGESGESLDSPGTETTAEIHIFHKPGGSSTGMTHFVGGFRHNEDGWLPPSLASLFQKAGHAHASEQVVAVRVTGAGLEWQHPVKSVKLCFSGKDPQPGWNILLGKLVRKWWPGSSDEGMADKFYRTISGYQLNQSSEFIVNGKIDTSCSRVSVRDDIRGDIVVPLNAGEAMTNSGFRVEITVVSRSSEKQASLSKSSSPVGLIPPGSANNNNPNLPLTLSSGGFGFDPDPRGDFKPRPAFGVNTDCELTDIQVALEVSDGAVELPEGIHPDDRVYYTHANGGTDPQYYVVINPARLNEIYQQCLGSLAADGLTSLYGAIYPGKDVQLQDVVDFLEGNGADPWSGMIMAPRDGKNPSSGHSSSKSSASGSGVSSFLSSHSSGGFGRGIGGYNGGGGENPDQQAFNCPFCYQVVPTHMLGTHFKANGCVNSPGNLGTPPTLRGAPTQPEEIFFSDSDDDDMEYQAAPKVLASGEALELLRQKSNAQSVFSSVTEKLAQIPKEKIWSLILDLNRYFTTDEFGISYSDYYEWAVEWIKRSSNLGQILKELQSGLEAKLKEKWGSEAAFTTYSLNIVSAAAIRTISTDAELNEVYTALKTEADGLHISLDISAREEVTNEDLLKYCEELARSVFSSDTLRRIELQNRVDKFVELIVINSGFVNTRVEELKQELRIKKRSYQRLLFSVENVLQLSNSCGISYGEVLRAVLNPAFSETRKRYITELELIAAVDKELSSLWRSSQAQRMGKAIRDQIALLAMDFSKRNILQGQVSVITKSHSAAKPEERKVPSYEKPGLNLSLLPPETLGIEKLVNVVHALEDVGFSTADWYTLGLNLKIKHNKLSTFSIQTDPYTEMLAHWLTNWPGGQRSTWPKLAQALIDMEKISCAAGLIEKIGQPEPVDSHTLTLAINDLKDYIAGGIRVWSDELMAAQIINKKDAGSINDLYTGQSAQERASIITGKLSKTAAMPGLQESVINAIISILEKEDTRASLKTLEIFKRNIGRS